MQQIFQGKQKCSGQTLQICPQGIHTCGVASSSWSVLTLVNFPQTSQFRFSIIGTMAETKTPEAYDTPEESQMPEIRGRCAENSLNFVQSRLKTHVSPFLWEQDIASLCPQQVQQLFILLYVLPKEIQWSPLNLKQCLLFFALHLNRIRFVRIFLQCGERTFFWHCSNYAGVKMNWFVLRRGYCSAGCSPTLKLEMEQKSEADENGKPGTPHCLSLKLKMKEMLCVWTLFN